MLSVTILNCSQYLDLAICIYISNIINERPSYRLIMHILLGRGWVVAWVCLFYRDWLIYIRLSNTLITNTVHLQKYGFQRYISSLEILHCLFWVICLSVGHLDYPITASETNTCKVYLLAFSYLILSRQHTHYKYQYSTCWWHRCLWIKSFFRGIPPLGRIGPWG